MKKKAIIKYIIPMLLMVFAVTVWFGTGRASGAVQTLQEIEAYYTGPAVEVGKAINLKDIYVTAHYYINDGFNSYDDYTDVKKGFTINPSVVKSKGENKVVVSYLGKNYVITVEGKEVESITADYTGEEVYVGAAVPLNKVEVYANFSDGSYEQIRDFVLSVDKVSREGLNTIPVTYKGKVANIFVYGKAPLAVTEIYADYIGLPVIAGNAISKSDILVNLLYNDGSYKEKVTNFNISPGYVKYEGENEITVTYGDVSTTVYVYGEERIITDMRARYTGYGVIVGKSVPKEEVEVTVTYNDGSDEVIDDFELYGAEIFFEGENIVLVYCDSYMSEITVQGVKGFAANYDNALSGYFVSEDSSHYTEVTLGMNVGVETEKFVLRAADQEMLNYVVQRVVPTDEFIGFDLFYDDDEMVLQFPMAMKVTVPDGFDPEKFGVYYTPNRSTIMAKVNGDFVDEGKTEYEFVAYEPGVYVLIHEVSNRLVTDIIVETEVELKENRNYSLNPVVFPLSADNREVTFWSSDEDVATVSSNGKIRSISEGTCEIWIEAKDGSGVYVIVTVEVKSSKK